MCTQEFTFDINYLSSKKNCVADALSRFPTPNIDHDDEDEDGQELIDALFEHLLIDKDEEPMYEEWLREIIYYFKFPGNADTNINIKQLSLKYYCDNKNPYRKVGQRFLPIPLFSERKAILIEIHDGHTHFGFNASWSRLYHEYWWPNSYEDLKAYIKSCRECQLFSSPISNPASNRVLIRYLFEQFSLDFVGPLPVYKNGNIDILVAVESFTKWPIAVPRTNTDAKTVANFVYTQIFCNFG